LIRGSAVREPGKLKYTASKFRCNHKNTLGKIATLQ
jgi:hypothetical protein